MEFRNKMLCFPTLILIAVGIIANKDHLIFLEVYGFLQAKEIVMRISCTAVLTVYFSSRESSAVFPSWWLSRDMLPEALSFWVEAEESMRMIIYFSFFFSILCINSLSRCPVVKLWFAFNFFVPWGKEALSLPCLRLEKMTCTWQTTWCVMQGRQSKHPNSHCSPY